MTASVRTGPLFFVDFFNFAFVEIVSEEFFSVDFVLAELALSEFELFEVVSLMLCPVKFVVSVVPFEERSGLHGFPPFSPFDTLEDVKSVFHN